MWLKSTEFDESEHSYYTVHISHNAYTKTSGERVSRSN